jgi:hypothetical protein
MTAQSSVCSCRPLAPGGLRVVFDFGLDSSLMARRVRWDIATLPPAGLAVAPTAVDHRSGVALAPSQHLPRAPCNFNIILSWRKGHFRLM